MKTDGFSRNDGPLWVDKNSLKQKSERAVGGGGWGGHKTLSLQQMSGDRKSGEIIEKHN